MGPKLRQGQSMRRKGESEQWNLKRGKSGREGPRGTRRRRQGGLAEAAEGKGSVKDPSRA